MKYFFDTEFFEDGRRIHPISLGMVCEDGRELYMEFKYGHVHHMNQFVKEHVLPHLEWENRDRIRAPEGGDRVREFVGEDKRPQFWAYFADYDWVLMCQMFGTMMDLPRNFPKFCMDLQQEAVLKGLKASDRPKKPVNQHHALADARWNRELYHAIQKVDRERDLIDTLISIADGEHYEEAPEDAQTVLRKWGLWDD